MTPGLYFNPKSSTPSSTTSSTKASDQSDSAVSNVTFELSIVGLPAPRLRSTRKNNVELTNQRRALKSAPVSAAKSVIKSHQRCDKSDVERPWTACKRKALKIKADLTDDDDVLLSGSAFKLAEDETVGKCSSTASQWSVSASSAGDVSSLGDESNSQYSQARSEQDKPIDTACFVSKDRFSFPVPARLVAEKLLGKAHEDDEIELLDQGKQLARERSEIGDLGLDFRSVHISRENGNCHQLVTIQEKILELLENQQACTRQTWLVLQQLSASLDFISKRSSREEQKRYKQTQTPSPSPIPEALLLKEAAGCALRLADILSLVGSTMTSSDINVPLRAQVVETQRTPQPAAFPVSAMDLQQQKGKLRPVSTEQAKFFRQRESLMDQLNASLALRRASICHPDQDCESTVSDEWT
ncbi:Hypothetical predicted protein [Cloeon dipterum]|uniref:Uncharacterized protein n=1 Tax=Cloeon dipterum TaxID=197152 RepID=A0A8S1D4J5_9INSE|nr:Hypothetical predicted protein [Cloeon dipterum]